MNRRFTVQSFSIEGLRIPPFYIKTAGLLAKNQTKDLAYKTGIPSIHIRFRSEIKEDLIP
jgi:hypothetical protein